MSLKSKMLMILASPVSQSCGQVSGEGVRPSGHRGPVCRPYPWKMGQG